MLNGGPMSWYFKRQAIIALSSMKHKYIALTLATSEATWLRLLLTKLSPLKVEDQYVKINVIQENSSI